MRATPWRGRGGKRGLCLPGVVGAAPLRRPGYEQRTPAGVQTPIGHTDRRSESATPYRGRGTPFNNWSTGLRGCAPRPVARERAPTRGAVHESDKSDKSDVLPKLVALPGIPTFVRGGSAAEGAILLETEYTKRGRRWGTDDPTCDLCIPIRCLLGGGLLDEVALDAHLGRALEVLLTELHLSDLLVGVEEGIDLLAHLLECCLGLLLLLF